MAASTPATVKESPLAVRQRADDEHGKFDPTIVPVSFDEAMSLALDTGDDATVVLDPWTALNQDKDPLVDRPLIVQHVKYMTDVTTPNNPTNYANMFIVRDDGQLFRVTDGSTGMYAQLSQITADRLDTGHKHPYGPFIFPNGLRKSAYGVDANGKAVPLGDPTQERVGATYYFA